MSVVNEIATLQGRVANETLYVENATTHGEYLEMASPIFSDSIYGQRMIDYYPQVISCIQEFRAIIKAEYPEIEELYTNNDRVINDAYLMTMTEERIEQWEHVLGIKPLEDSTIDDRRETVIARIRGQGKLNSTLINSIVNAFTGGTANSWVEDGVLYVEITPPPNNKQYKFANVEQELRKKIPAHLGFDISRNYFTWQEIFSSHPTWQDVKDGFDTWNDVYLYVPFSKVRRYAR